MVSSDIYRNVMDVYLDIRDKYEVKSEKDRKIVIDSTLVGEAAAAYCALSMIDGMINEHPKKFIDRYCKDVDKRHVYRARLLSCELEDEKYEKFKKFAMEFEGVRKWFCDVRKRLRGQDFQTLDLNNFGWSQGLKLNDLKTLFFNLLNELTYI